MLTFPSAPNHVRHLPQAKVNLLLPTAKLNSLTDFFSNPQNPPRTLPMHDIIHILRSHFLSGVSIVTSLNDTSAPRARERQRLWLHLTNPYAKRKVLSLTKPKGKIYKTKSLSLYYRPCLTRARVWPSAGLLTHHFLRPQGGPPSGFYPLMGG